MFFFTFFSRCEKIQKHTSSRYRNQSNPIQMVQHLKREIQTKRLLYFCCISAVFSLLFIQRKTEKQKKNEKIKCTQRSIHNRIRIGYYISRVYRAQQHFRKESIISSFILFQLNFAAAVFLFSFLSRFLFLFLYLFSNFEHKEIFVASYLIDSFSFTFSVFHIHSRNRSRSR